MLPNFMGQSGSLKEFYRIVPRWRFERKVSADCFFILCKEFFLLYLCYNVSFANVVVVVVVVVVAAAAARDG